MTDSNPVVMASANGLVDKSKELQKEILMEKLRSKTSQFKNLTETSKGVRMALLDKRWGIDSADRMILKKCLDSLQHCIKVSSLQSLIERLECLSRQLGLKFVVGTSGVNLFISSDMFYLEILVESSGSVKDVKIHHEGKIEQQSCEELVQCISRGDFADFTAQLEGLTAVYQLGAEKKVTYGTIPVTGEVRRVKCKAFSALQSLEEDLCTMRQLQSFIKDPWAQVHKSPIGFLQKRRGGHAMRLTYFVSPYELLDKEKGLNPLTVELLTIGKPTVTSGLASLVAPSHTPIGHSATVLLEGSPPNKLQLSPIISGGQRPGKGNGPVYAQLVPQNSAMLPACFTLKLSQPTPLCAGLAKLIHATTDVEVAGDWSNGKPMLGLVAQQAYNKLTPGKVIELNLSKGLFVHLPDQTQCFFLCESRGLEGCMVSSVPFTHPSHVAPLLACLRQQQLFNALISSCVRTQTKHWAYLSEQQHHLSVMCQDTAATDTKPTEERKSKKRKSDDVWASAQKKGKPSGITEMMDSDSESDNSDEYVNEDENTNNSNSTNDDIEGRESSVSQNEFTSDMELSGMDATDALGAQDNRTSSDMDNSNDGDVDDIIRNSFHKSDHKRQKLKSKDSELRTNRSTSSLLLDLTEGKSYMPSSVSITPIGTTSNTPNAGTGSSISSMLCLDRRPGIEIIPITAAAPAALPSSITITPITSSQMKTLDDRIRSEKKSSRSGEERSKEKKKKRRRDDSMGPPEKVPPKQDPLTKPVSVSIKPTDGSPLRATSPNSLIRKFSPSPTHGRSVSITKSPSPSTVKGMGKPSGTSSHHNSPRHSPVQNSPKHLPGYSSPKNHSVSSPKHSSSGSGKPSMSALKSATSGSPSGKSGTTGYDLTKKLSKDSYSSSSVTSRDKEKKHSSLSFSSSDRSSPKLKNPIKLKQLEITPVTCDSPVTEPLISPPNIEVNKSNAPSQARNRKGSLSAVIDKLKSAQHCGTDSEISAKSSSSSSSAKFSDPKTSTPSSSGKLSDSKNQEYMVKPSSDGMKITINKTRTKDSSSSSSKLNYSSSSSKSPQLTPPSQGSPKTHTGLKPGVISGPASKKTQAMQSSKSGSVTSGSTPPKANMSPSDSSGSSNPNMPKVPYSKSSSTSNAGINLSKSSSKSSSGSPKSSSTDLAKIIRDREREKARTKLMTNSEKSIFSSKSERHSSPSGSRDEVDGERFKGSKESNFLVEGLIKPLDTSKFQIPKLKNQNTPDKNSPASQYDQRSLVNDFARSLEQSKYPFPHFDNQGARTTDSLQKSAYPLNVPKPLLNMGSMSPKTIPPGKNDQSDRPLEFSKAMAESISKGESPVRNKDDSKDGFTSSFPIMPLDFKTEMAKGFAAPKGSSEDRKGADSCMKPPASGAVARSGATTPQEAAEMLLDFSSSSGSKVSGLVAVRPVYPSSPALALQLAKSPAPSPLVAPSPHSNSPCITDDELMDEALVGPGK
ncbi:hypothetical protein HF086_007876 [Spodoptera exigua]|uniref:Mediator of RNA polymerase II transcription subunit 1 n=1 Tax=Spodoptera exigua TaxID=7107 RepID=A0A922MXK2_SPOEX|nr:hypothetical protein HF086_007876 [Spodoptera exigua]